MSAGPRAVESCLGCGLPSDASDRCPACDTPRGSGQRRVVTLLFADLAGFTSLAAARDPEEVHVLIRPLMNALRAAAKDFGGLVPSIDGDGLMAAFGAGESQPEDPARALAAAVEMQKLAVARRTVDGDVPQLRIGLHLGVVLVAPSWEPAGVALSGDPVNTASRLCAVADAGEILASDAFAEASRVRHGWSTEWLAQLKGRADLPVRRFAWRELQELVPPSWRPAEAYVARPALEEAVRRRTGGLQVLGEAGSGKTRLVEEVLGESRPLVARCASFHTARLSPVLAQVLGELGHTGLAQAMTGTATVEAGPELEWEQVLAAAELLRATTGRPVVIDDCDRLPESERELLRRLVSETDFPALLLTQEDLGVPGLARVVVPALTAEESAALLDALLPGAGMTLRHAVLERAAGSPLFLEQCTRLLQESGAVHVDSNGSQLVAPEKLRDVPTSMRLFVAGRLDLLAPAEREVLATAAVLGDTPEPALLRHLTGDLAEDHLNTLVRRGLLVWKQGDQGPPQLAFTHALVRDVAYDALLRARRSEIHRAAAEWYSVLPVAQVLEAQAFHLEAAVSLGDSDCDLVRRAVAAMTLYARSIEAERTRIATEALERAEALATRRSECAPDLLQLRLAWSAVQQEAGHLSRAVESAEHARQLAIAVGDVAAEAEAELLLGRALALEEPDRAGTHLTAAARLFDDLDDLAGRARVEIERAIVAEQQVGLAALVRHLEQAYHWAMRSGDVRLQAHAAQQLAFHGAGVTGRTAFEQWAALAEQVSRADDVGLQPRLDMSRAVLADCDLDPAAGLEPSRRALVAGRELGLMHIHQNALVLRADLLVVAGQAAAAAALVEEGLAVAAARPGSRMGPVLQLIGARAAQRAGNADAARATLRSFEANDVLDQRALRREWHETSAWLALESGRFEESQAHAVQAALLDEQLEDRVFCLRPRLLAIIAATAGSTNPQLGDIAALHELSRAAGLALISGLATRWLLVDEATRGWSVDLHGLEPRPDIAEVRALELEIRALTARDADALLEAAAEWAALGDCVWRAQALLWHSELTGSDDAEAQDLLRRLGAPKDTAARLRGRIAALKNP